MTVSTFTNPEVSGLKGTSKSRVLSANEAHFAYTHENGLYHMVILSAKYTPLDPGLTINKDTLYPALELVVRQNPTLTTVLSKENDETLYFKVAEAIDLDQHTKFLEGEQSEEELLKVYEERACTKFDNMDTVGPWRVIVSKVKKQDENIVPSYEIAFCYLHSISDGTGGRIFLTKLFNALNTTANADIEHFNPLSLPKSDEIYGLFSSSKSVSLANAKNSIIKINPDAIDLIPSAEEAIGVTMTSEGLKSKLYDEENIAKAGNECWSGPLQRPKNEKFGTSLFRTKISSETMKNLLANSRKEKTTVSCTMSVLFLAAIDQCIPDSREYSDYGDYGGLDPNGKPYKTIKATIARNVRFLAKSESGVKEDTMLCSAAELPMVTERGSLVSLENIWENSRLLRKNLNEANQQGAVDLSIGLYSYLKPFSKTFDATFGSHRRLTCLVSSLLVPDPRVFENKKWDISDVSFLESSISNMPIALSTSSFKGGDLLTGYAWDSKDIPHSLIYKISNKFIELMNQAATI